MYINGIFVNVIMLQGDGIKGCVRKNNDDSYTIFINPAYSLEQQKQTALHELKHILQIDVDAQDRNIDVLEYYAHKVG